MTVSEFLGVGPRTWRFLLVLGALAMLFTAVGAVSSALDHDWYHTAYFTAMSAVFAGAVWRNRTRARSDAPCAD